MGLSPQARGKRAAAKPARLIPGPIPASAGETEMDTRQWDLTGAYPRKRGGNKEWQMDL